MNINQKFLLCSLLTTGLALGTLAASSPSWALCKGFGCEGLDPQVQGCTKDAMLLDHFALPNLETGIPAATVVLYFSSACDAKWATLDTTGRAQNRLSVTLETDDGGVLWGKAGRADASNQYRLVTPMTRGMDQVMACGNGLASTPALSWGCTALH